MLNNTHYKNILQSTFQHLKRIGNKTEKKLWADGITTWYDFASIYNRQLSIFNDAYSDPILRELQLSFDAFEQNNANFFAESLPQSEHFRIVLSFFENTMFLDIETTGLSKYYDYITMVGWSKGGKYYYILKGDDDSFFKKSIADAKCLVTFNGSIFDIPFLKQEFHNISLPKTHVDLRFFSRRVGLSGGQKEIENKIKVKRPRDINDVDGKAATILWYKFLKGDTDALKDLIKYNYYDVSGMRIIFNETVKRIIKKEKFPLSNIPVFKNRIPLFQISLDTKKLKKKIKKLNSSLTTTSFHELTLNKNYRKINVIGIDLTGSEKRASGCCLLKKNTSYTQLINSDTDIINYVIENKPNLVSIDSPLSLPKGRKTVDDDDPGRHEFGIMRSCERILKKRGVNVYPSLIPSMQKLTQRGIQLTEILRSLGIPVIESYPGAAQDILKIPRKRSDIIMLKEGLIDIGITGDFQHKEISHDELDAITSALVGYFFWYGKYEALGNLDEDYLIIPDLSVKKSIWGERIVIGISGPMATGKTTAGNILEKKGFFYTRFSLILDKKLIEQGKEVNRENLQRLGLHMKEKGQRKLCTELFKTISTEGNIVIDGLRHPEDHAFFVEYFGPNFFHIYIDSSLLLRRERYINMGNPALEFDIAIDHKVESNVQKLSELAHIIIKNENSLSDLETTLYDTVPKA